MTREEIKKAIENGEMVWCLYQAHKEIEGLYLSKDNKYKFESENSLDGKKEVSLIINYDWYYPLKYLFKTKAEAEHYLHHANVERVEKLPFLTWEEFNEKELFFTNKSGYPMRLCIIDTKLGKKIGLGGSDGHFALQQIWDLTEESFYKAYDECVRLFRGGE